VRKMEKFIGFRADRLLNAMRENEVCLDDIYEEYKKSEKLNKNSDSKLTLIDFKCRLINIAYNSESIEPTIEELYIICYAVGCSADYLLGLKDEIY